MDFKTQLVEFRKKANMSIARLSQLSGVPTSTICNYEHGVMPTLDKADKLLRALGASVVVGKVATIRAHQEPVKLNRSRGRGCQYCTGDLDGYTTVIRGWKGPGRMYIPEGKPAIVVSGKYNHRAYINIAYCPFCGRPLTERAWKELKGKL